MSFIRLTDDPIVKRLRWIMAGAMLFSIVNTLAGQPGTFWSDPGSAIRGDGLSIHNPTNHSFEFFLGYGWQAYLAATLAYLAAAFLLVSLLPRKAALVSAFSFVFGHYFGASNWLAVRWHLGAQGFIVYGIVLSTILVLAAFPAVEDTSTAIRRLRWVMLATIALDFTITLLGQPDSYWLHPETVNEANQLFRGFMVRGWTAYLLFDLFYLLGTFVLVSMLPRMTALISIFAFIFGHVLGLSTWLFYRWRLGMEAPVAYGIVVSIAIVWLTFPSAEERPEHLIWSYRDGDRRVTRSSSLRRLQCWLCGR